MRKAKALRDHLAYRLEGGGAHVHTESCFRSVPPELRGRRLGDLPHSAWELLEHLRIAQWDILEYSRNPDHVSPTWPEGYWPDSPEPSSAEAWTQSLATFQRELAEMVGMVSDPDNDLLAPFPWNPEHTLLREALLVADHNAYHLGQVVLLRRFLGVWPPD